MQLYIKSETSEEKLDFDNIEIEIICMHYVKIKFKETNKGARVFIIQYYGLLFNCQW